ncbi:MAG TPA: YegS/Rv2252/BmrU family lipid kinase [Candidatus Lachnoclostridium stercoripullorum]|uniref:YegS/Rv2252/BmrU family lipid kinase n=1 Tax=Candidatus Lachnoclostridium stercoripullorum TaxID=2838635 RepID=A0A9D1W308_9FIRM|nr:YegS/Rv2252/BmrU family lipid kinase [Candidatus Lachnoclostridium stercoripullorum]
MKRLLFIINPCSGKGRIRNKLLSVLDVFAKRGYRVETYVTQEALDARRKAVTRGRSADLIVCSGGDGTLNEVVSGMMELKRLPVLGYIPAGSTNDYAASLGLPRRIENAARLAAEGKASPVDVGKFGDDRYFVYIAAFGAFTEVSYLTPQDKKNLLGHQAYMLEAVKSLMDIRGRQMKITWEEGELEGEFLFGMVTNTTSVGGFKGLVSRDVALDDGWFEALFIRMPKNPLDLSGIVSYLFLKEEDNAFVYRFKTRKLKIAAAEDVDWVLDGEFGGKKREVEIENLEKRLYIVRG